MTYLFFLHSSITHLVAKKVIDVEDLPIDKCRFIYTRGGNYEEDFVEKITFDFSLRFYDYQFKFWKIWKDISQIDSWLEKVCGKEQFTLYVPHTLFPATNFIITNKLCKGYYYIEEGMANYIDSTKLNTNAYVSKQPLRKYRILNFINFKFRAPITRTFFTTTNYKYKGVYAISDLSFKNFPNRTIIGLPFKQIIDFPNCEHIIVLEGINEKLVFNPLAYIMGLLQLIKYFISIEVKEIYIKFHPYQHEKDYYYTLMKEFFNSYKHILIIKELENNLILENLAFSYNIKFYMTISSMGLYAMLCGREVYSFSNYIIKYDANFSKVLKFLPEWYRKQMINLK